MTGDGCIALTAESPAGRADLLVDAQRPLEHLLRAIAAATGADPGGVWTVTEGQRTLGPLTSSLVELGVVAGCVLRLNRGAA